MNEKLTKNFYQRSDVVLIARELIGKVLCTKFNGKFTAGIITETEAYAGIIDKASHAYGGKRTARTEVMYSEGGVSYVYLCYGIHHLFNVVTGKKDDPHAVLIRAVKPLDGIPEMLKRRNHSKLTPLLSAGPGTLSVALGIKKEHTAMDLLGDLIWIEDRGIVIMKKTIKATPRIGVDYAGSHAQWPYRFLIKNDGL